MIGGTQLNQGSKSEMNPGFVLSILRDGDDVEYSCDVDEIADGKCEGAARA